MLGRIWSSIDLWMKLTHLKPGCARYQALCSPNTNHSDPEYLKGPSVSDVARVKYYCHHAEAEISWAVHSQKSADLRWMRFCHTSRTAIMLIDYWWSGGSATFWHARFYWLPTNEEPGNLNHISLGSEYAWLVRYWKLF